MMFMLVGRSDPIYDADFGPDLRQSKSELAYLHQFVAHSALDMIEATMWG
jgi:hypothetical protein